MKKLEEIKKRYIETDLTAEEALKEIFSIYLVSDFMLKKFNLTIEYVDYGLHRLRQNGKFIKECERAECLEIAAEIIKKANR